jgi:hypothetical protein
MSQQFELIPVDGTVTFQPHAVIDTRNVNGIRKRRKALDINL